ncbi:MAG TPA: cell division protein FtsQ [Bavariicoccus seileri]|uniref:Cell division protein FtsQ n=2 Tax=Bavariicoccus seileri TaxID=549685 RepID=A0A3D4S359_9ENTE|nr:cell division protein FtsQ [Bavariicoccus seileri]
MSIMGRQQQKNDAQKLMIFVLSMSLYGIATMFTELIPSIQVGIVEFSIEYFFFIPLTLAMLLDPLSVALGAATGELVFSEIMLGQFGGLGEAEKFITVTIGILVAGRLVTNPTDKKRVGVAAALGVFVQLGLGFIVDVLKVQLAVEDFEAVAGLPESVYFTEGFSLLNDFLFSGILFCILPTLYLVPKLYGKIEPLMGIRPRDKSSFINSGNAISGKTLFYMFIAFLAAIAAEFLSETGFELIDWEASWAESSPAMLLSIMTAVVLLIIAVIVIVKRRSKKIAPSE